MITSNLAMKLKLNLTYWKANNFMIRIVFHITTVLGLGTVKINFWLFLIGLMVIGMIFIGQLRHLQIAQQVVLNLFSPLLQKSVLLCLIKTEPIVLWLGSEAHIYQQVLLLLLMLAFSSLVFLSLFHYVVKLLERMMIAIDI